MIIQDQTGLYGGPVANQFGTIGKLSHTPQRATRANHMSAGVERHGRRTAALIEFNNVAVEGLSQSFSRASIPKIGSIVPWLDLIRASGNYSVAIWAKRDG